MVRLIGLEGFVEMKRDSKCWSNAWPISFTFAVYWLSGLLKKSIALRLLCKIVEMWKKQVLCQ